MGGGQHPGQQMGLKEPAPLWRKMPPLGYFDVVFGEGLVLSGFSVTFPEF